MENQGTKRVGPLWVLIVIIIVLGIVYLAFKPAQQADAPTVEDASIATTSVDAVPETPVTPAVVPPTPAVAPVPATDTGVQVIQGDGFTATVRPVTTSGEPPVIASFAVRQEPGENCIFSWEATNATSCDVTNTTMKTVVRGVPAKGSLQTDEPGTYQLTCKASGGKTATSNTAVCK